MGLKEQIQKLSKKYPKHKKEIENLKDIVNEYYPKKMAKDVQAFAKKLGLQKREEKQLYTSIFDEYLRQKFIFSSLIFAEELKINYKKRLKIAKKCFQEVESGLTSFETKTEDQIYLMQLAKKYKIKDPLDLVPRFLETALYDTYRSYTQGIDTSCFIQHEPTPPYKPLSDAMDTLRNLKIHGTISEKIKQVITLFEQQKQIESKIISELEKMIKV